MLDNEHQGTQGLLRKSSTPVPPAELQDRVMLSVLEIADKRAKKRAAFSGLLRLAAILLLLSAVGKACLPATANNHLVSKAVQQITENPGGKIAWLLENTYLVIPLIVLYVFSLIVRIKTDS